MIKKQRKETTQNSRGQPERESNDRIKRLNIARGSITDRLNIKQRNDADEPFSVSEDEFVETAKEETKVETLDQPTFELAQEQIEGNS